MAGEFWITCDTVVTLAAASMRDREAIDSALRLIGAVRRSIREHGIEPSSRQVDELLDRLAASASCSPGMPCSNPSRIRRPRSA
jgi:hypothetical protein